MVNKKMQTIVSLVLVNVLLMVFSVQASDLSVPNSFTAGTPAKASEVNANFTAVKSAVDDNYARLPMVWASTDGAGGALDLPAAVLTEINSLTITAPSDGVITISGSSSVNPATAAGGWIYLRAFVDGVVPTAAQYAAASTLQGSWSDQSYTITVPITAGQHTVSQSLQPVAAGARSFYRYLTVMFFPAAQSSYNP